MNLLLLIINVPSNLAKKLSEIKSEFEKNIDSAFNTDLKIIYGSNTVTLKLLNSGGIDKKLLNVDKDTYESNHPTCLNTLSKYVEYSKVFPKGWKYRMSYLYNSAVNVYRNINYNKTIPITGDYICKVMHSKYPTDNWIEAQIKYIRELSLEDQELIQSYSYKGDVFINLFLRNKMKVNEDIKEAFDGSMKYGQDIYKRFMGKEAYDFNRKNKTDIINYTDDDVEKYGYAYYQKLNTLILNSPTTEKFSVYRGINVRIKAKRGEIFTANSFLSTSLTVDTALSFSTMTQDDTFEDPDKIDDEIDESDDDEIDELLNNLFGTIMEYEIKDKCLLNIKSLYPGELEVILPYHEIWKVKSFNEDAEFLDVSSVSYSKEKLTLSPFKANHICYY